MSKYVIILPLKSIRGEPSTTMNKKQLRIRMYRNVRIQFYDFLLFSPVMFIKLVVKVLFLYRSCLIYRQAFSVFSFELYSKPHTWFSFVWKRFHGIDVQPLRIFFLLY